MHAIFIRAGKWAIKYRITGYSSFYVFAWNSEAEASELQANRKRLIPEMLAHFPQKSY